MQRTIPLILISLLLVGCQESETTSVPKQTSAANEVSVSPMQEKQVEKPVSKPEVDPIYEEIAAATKALLAD